MTVISHREVLPRTFQHRFGESPTAERKWIVTVDQPTPHQEVIDAVGIVHGSFHPEYPYLRMRSASLSEPDRQHVEITYAYEVPKNENDDPNPLSRADVWSFSVGGASGPALAYYHGDGNNDIRPLVNAAGDFVEGLERVECEVKATINGNRARFPLASAAAVTNSINSSPYLGGATYTWLCAGIGAQQAVEIVNDQEVRYYQISVELVYRPRGWIEQIPHVGWHFVSGGKKQKAWTWSGIDGQEKENASSPQPLTENGDLKYPGASGNPDILYRRLFPAIPFSQYFGTPPF